MLEDTVVTWGNLCLQIAVGSHGNVSGVMKMGNIVPRVRLKPTALAFLPSVLPLNHIGSLMSPRQPHLHVYAAPYLRGQGKLLYLSS